MIDELLSLIPPHRTFVDHTAGGLSLLLAMDPEGRSEIVNDIDGDVTCFWDVMKDECQFASFVRRCQATPFSRIDYIAAQAMLDVPPSHPWLRAWGFFVRVRQSMGGMQKSFAPITTTRTRRGMNEQVAAWLSAVDGLPEVHARLKRVLVLNDDISDSIDKTDDQETFHYIDTPYLPDTRQSKKLYRFEMPAMIADETPDENGKKRTSHERLLQRLLTVKGKFLLCGYPSALYDQYATLGNWRVHTFAKANSASKKAVKPVMAETVWTNF